MGLKWSYCLRHGRLRVTWREVKERRGLREGREREGGEEEEEGREGERGRGREGERKMKHKGTNFEQLFDVWSTLN